MPLTTPDLQVGFLPDIAAFPTKTSRQCYFPLGIIGENGFCGSVKKGHQSQIPHPNPLQSQEVFIIDKINLTRYLRTLLKSFISLLTQAAQEDYSECWWLCKLLQWTLSKYFRKHSCKTLLIQPCQWQALPNQPGPKGNTKPLTTNPPCYPLRRTQCMLRIHSGTSWSAGGFCIVLLGKTGQTWGQKMGKDLDIHSQAWCQVGINPGMLKMST